MLDSTTEGSNNVSRRVQRKIKRIRIDQRSDITGEINEEEEEEDIQSSLPKTRHTDEQRMSVPRVGRDEVGDVEES